jgi:hypothetical protein
MIDTCPCGHCTVCNCYLRDRQQSIEAISRQKRDELKELLRRQAVAMRLPTPSNVATK